MSRLSMVRALIVLAALACCCGGHTTPATPSAPASPVEEQGASNPRRLLRDVPLGRAGVSTFELTCHQETSSSRSSTREIADLVMGGEVTWMSDVEGSFTLSISVREEDIAAARELDGTRYEGFHETDGSLGSFRLFLPVPRAQLSSSARDLLAQLSDMLRRGLEVFLPDEALPVEGSWTRREVVEARVGVDIPIVTESVLLSHEGDEWTIRTTELSEFLEEPPVVEETAQYSYLRTLAAGNLLCDMTYTSEGSLHTEPSEGRFFRTEDNTRGVLSASSSSERVRCDMRELIGTCQESPAAEARPLVGECHQAGGRLELGPCPTEDRFGQCQTAGQAPLYLYRPFVASEEVARRLCVQVPFIPEP